MTNANIASHSHLGKVRCILSKTATWEYVVSTMPFLEMRSPSAATVKVKEAITRSTKSRTLPSSQIPPARANGLWPKRTVTRFTWQNLKSTVQHQQINAKTPNRARKCQTNRNKYIWLVPSASFEQFQALFDSLFKVLFIFPSRYLFAIGLSQIFSFRWHLPPT